MALSWLEKGLWQICMHHWTVHAKAEFHKFPPDVRSGASIPQLLILNAEMNLNIFLILGGPFHKFWSWTEKWKIYIDIFYGDSCNIKCITAISKLHFH